MATFTYVELDLPEADRLNSLFGIQAELEDVIECCDRYQVMWPHYIAGDAPEHEMFLRSLWASIPIKYARCFKTGRRVPIPGGVVDSHMTKTEKEVHEFFISVRDKHIAHSVNEFEVSKLRVWLNPEERGGRRINNVNTALHRVSMPSGKHFQALGAVARKLLSWISTEITSEQNKVKAYVEKSIPLDDLYKMKVAPVVFGRTHKVGDSRERA